MKVFGHHIPFNLLIRTLIEFIVLILSIPLAFELNKYDSSPLSQSLLIGWVYAFVVILSMAAAGLYKRHDRLNNKELLFKFTVSSIFIFLLMSVFFYSFHVLFIARTTFLYALSLSIPTLIFIRLFNCFLNQKVDFLKRNVLVYGTGHQAAKLSHIRRISEKSDFQIVGFVPIEGEEIVVSKEFIIQDDIDLNAYVKEHDVSQVILALEDRRNKLPMDALLKCKIRGVDIIYLSTFFERHFGRITLDSISPSFFVFSDGFIKNNLNDHIKRLFDIIVSLSLLIIAWPFMLITTLLIILESQSFKNILYKQIRVGKYNKNFPVLKFRSMVVDAEKNGAQFAQSSDPRVTAIGNFIRKTRIDELPQLFNVLFGQMSFVGPRPERPEFVKDFTKEIKYYGIRHHVKPGITGWAQICYPYGASIEDTKNKLEFDLYYMKNYSLFLDVMIIIQTVQVVLWKQGSR